jgi:hypothetical protein
MFNTQMLCAPLDTHGGVRVRQDREEQMMQVNRPWRGPRV